MREMLYGRHAIYESLRSGRRVPYSLILAKGIRRTELIAQVVSLVEQSGAPVNYRDRHDLDQLVHANHQGMVLEAGGHPHSSLDDVLALAQSREEAPLVLMLDLLQDPQNIGTLIRTAEGAAVHGLVIQQRRAVGVTPAVVRASSGAVEHLLVSQVTNLVAAIRSLKSLDVWVAGLDSGEGGQTYHEADLSGPLALVVGSEGGGLRRLVREQCDFLVRLPMLGQVSSLNASVAGSIVLYEVVRQRMARASS